MDERWVEHASRSGISARSRPTSSSGGTATPRLPTSAPTLEPSTRHGDAPPRDDPASCPVERTLRLVSGRWRLLILFRLGAWGPTRWGALRRSLAPVTPRVLTKALRDLEADGLVWRHAEPSVPPVVTYGLAARGEALAPVFEVMAAWGVTLPDAERAPSS